MRLLRAHDKRPGNTSGLVKGPRPGWCDGPGWPVEGWRENEPTSDPMLLLEPYRAPDAPAWAAGPISGW